MHHNGVEFEIVEVSRFRWRWTIFTVAGLRSPTKGPTSEPFRICSATATLSTPHGTRGLQRAASRVCGTRTGE
jgi:hypothetical protein